MGNRLSLFEAFGIEIEYMIVDAATLDVRPICDRLFTEVAGRFVDGPRPVRLLDNLRLVADGPVAG